MSFFGTGEIFQRMYFSQQLDKERDKVHEGNDLSDDESGSEFQQLFPRKLVSQKKIKDDNSLPDGVYIFTAVCFVVGFAAIASYQSFKNGEFGQELEHSKIKINDVFKVYDDATDQVLYNSTKLPTHLKPVDYVIYLYPNILNKNLSGLVRIKMHCVSATSQIILHSSMSKIRNLKLVESSTNHEIKIVNFFRNPNKSFLIMTLNRTLSQDNYYDLYLSFYSYLNYDMSKGIYISDYKDGMGIKHQMVSTMFESTQARNTFPCFDEPQLKAPFKLIVRHHKEFQAVSNMPVVNTSFMDDSTQETFFKATPVMSTYLLCLAITEYSFRKVVSTNGVPIRAYAPVGRLHETNFSLTIAPLVVDYYGKLFGINYTLPKLDLMPVSVFPAAADENWGMIMFNEPYLLYDPLKDSINQLEYIAKTVAHEIAHLWFGDLVTPAWWTDVWLKESFATFLEFLPLEKFYPSWDLSTSFYDSNVNAALLIDASAYTHAIYTNEQDPEKIRLMYDGITYEKGSAVVTMLANNFLSRDEFFKGVHVYLRKYQYGNANVTQFWDEMAKANNIDVRNGLKNWVHNPGFPLVTFTLRNREISTRQERFLYNGVKKISNDTFWSVPISIQLDNFAAAPIKYTLTMKEQYNITSVNNSKWYKANYGATGYYRVNYDDGNWRNLLHQFNTNHTVFAAVDRANIIADVLTLSYHGIQPLNLSLDFLKYLSVEHHHIPWSMCVSQLQLIIRYYTDTNISRCAKNLMLKLTAPVMDYLNQYRTYTHMQKHLISLMLALNVRVNNKFVVDKMLNKFLKWMVSNSTRDLPTSLRALVYHTGVLYGGVYEWDYMLHYYQRASSVSEQQIVLQCLSSTKDERLLQRFVDDAFNANVIESKDSIQVLQYVCGNVRGRDIAWRAVKKNWNTIYKQSRSSSTTIKYLLDTCLSSSHAMESITETIDFFKNYDVGLFNKLQNKIVERIQHNYDVWRKRNEFEAWFNTNYPGCDI